MNKRAKTTPVRKQRIYMVRTVMVLIGIVLVFAIGGGVVYINNQTTPKTYTSEFMKIDLRYPSNYRLENKTNNVYLLRNNLESERIDIFQMGTAYNSSLEHAKTIIELNRTKISKMVQIDRPYEGVMVDRAPEEGGGRSYIYVRDHMVYIFSTENSALFSDLDSIAKSFRILQ